MERRGEKRRGREKEERKGEEREQYVIKEEEK